MQQLSGLDASFLTMETPTTFGHVGGLSILEPGPAGEPLTFADVSVTMQALARHFGLRDVELDVTFTSLTMSCRSHEDDRPLVSIRQVKQRDIDYQDLTLVDELVRHVLADEVDLAEARREIGRIVSTGHRTPRWAVTAGWGVMCGAVALRLSPLGLLLGGAGVVTIVTGLVGFCPACAMVGRKPVERVEIRQ